MVIIKFWTLELVLSGLGPGAKAKESVAKFSNRSYHVAFFADGVS